MHSLAGWPDCAEKVSIATGGFSRRGTASRTLSRQSRRPAEEGAQPKGCATGPRPAAVDEVKIRKTGRVATCQGVAQA
jgi:hypothetical protein